MGNASDGWIETKAGIPVLRGLAVKRKSCFFYRYLLASAFTADQFWNFRAERGIHTGAQGPRLLDVRMPPKANVEIERENS